MTPDREAAERAVAAFLEALGLSPASDPELADTPARVTEAFLDELLVGRSVDLGALCRGGTPAESHQGLVVAKGLAVTTVCPHHLLPALGTAVVAYHPGERVLGIGTLAELMDAAARRPILQERIGEEVVGALMTHAGARGAWCRLELKHGCLSARGPRQAGALVTTIASRGTLAGEAGSAELALSLGAGGG